MNDKTLQYVRQHADEDVRLLALRGCKDPEVDLDLALQQIQGRQTAKHKLPSWAAIDEILYPPHLNMEQCSSEQTARYKAAVARRLMSSINTSLNKPCVLLDLTGGFGVDFVLMSELFDKSIYVERDATLFSISSANFPLFGLQAETVCADGMNFFRTIGHVTMLFIDPARRNIHGGRTYGITDCTPNVLTIKDEMLQKADIVMLKLSPMLDWRKAVGDLGKRQVSEVHIVSVGGECKELLIVMQRQANETTIFCVNDNQCFSFIANQTSNTLKDFRHPQTEDILLVPNASVMKAGCFGELSKHFGISQIAANSHLFVNEKIVADFPGRQFQIEAVLSMNKRDLKEGLKDIRQANIAVRNFPLSVVELRKRLKLNEGGSKYLFATTLANGDKVLILCQHL